MPSIKFLECYTALIIFIARKKELAAGSPQNLDFDMFFENKVFLDFQRLTTVALHSKCASREKLSELDWDGLFAGLPDDIKRTALRQEDPFKGNQYEKQMIQYPTNVLIVLALAFVIGNVPEARAALERTVKTK